MKVSNIGDKKFINYIFNFLSKTPNIKAIDININDQNNNPYIHIDINIFDRNSVEVIYTTNSFVNNEIEDLDNDKFIEIFGLDPNAMLKGPIEYKEIETIYEYFKGPENDIIDNNQKVFFCIGENLIKTLNKIHNEL
jgi:hypothetical protein